MVAFKSPLKPSVSASKSAAFPIQTPCRDPNRLACLNFGFRSALELKNTLSLDRIKKDLVRKMGGGGRFNGCSMLRRKPEIDTVSGGDNVVDAAAETKLVPDHLVVMVNGIIGSAEDWRYAAEQFAKKLSDRVVVYCSECNPSKLTFDGVDSMGERLANEVLDVARWRPKVQKISFVAHSLGGLVARYAIGRLYSQHVISVDTTKKFSCKEGASTIMDCPQQPHGDRIAGLEPMNFITFATPHLGSSGHNQVPMLFGLPFLERGASQTAHLIVGRSGKHLFLTDNDEGRRPLLLRMVNDNEDIKFMSALRSFKRRVAYANANYDYVVGWRTSSIRRQWELPKSHLIAKDERYPHIVSVEREFKVNTHSVASHVVSDKSADFEEEMIRGLTQVPWERVDVSFQSSRQRYVAHNTIQVKTYWLNSDGADVVFHMIDSFLL